MPVFLALAPPPLDLSLVACLAWWLAALQQAALPRASCLLALAFCREPEDGCEVEVDRLFHVGRGADYYINFDQTL